MTKRTREGKPAGTAGRGARERQVRREESDLFRSAMGDITPLDGVGAPPEPGTTPPPSARRRATGRDAPPSTRDRTDLPELSPGAAAGLDTRTMERLRKGRLRPEARLDLHGMTQDEAHRALPRFLAASRQQGRRCVIVITGKGRVSEGGGVLRNQVPRWLNLPDCRPHILGFAAAQPKDGGTGALYVLLRRADK